MGASESLGGESEIEAVLGGSGAQPVPDLKRRTTEKRV